ncbi:MAG: hypothetical protein RBR68_15500 [Tenuifilaceae bacterium]|nr:hypothetical protein [Tenuifilaceae bacterium]
MTGITSTTYPNGTTVSWTVPNNTACDYPERFLVGDRVVIKEGFYGAGRTFIVLGKSTDEPEQYILQSVKTGTKDWAMESALELKPYTKKEIAQAFCKEHKLSKKIEKSLIKLLKNQ